MLFASFARSERKSPATLDQGFVSMAGTYGNVHRAVVQTFMSKKIMPEKEALELVKSAARCVRRRVRACAALPLAARLLRAVRARSLSRHPPRALRASR